MDIQQSLAIVKTLANGTDPFTGEVFTPDSPYNHPQVVRALYACIQHIEHPPKRTKRTPEERQAENVRVGRPRNYGMPWTKELTVTLEQAFKAGKSPAQLAKKFERSKSSIVSQLLKQGLISEEEALDHGRRVPIR